MGQPKVRFTIEHLGEKYSFATLTELKQHSFSHVVMERLADFEKRIILAAANDWLAQKLGQDKIHSFQIQFVKDSKSIQSEKEHQKA